MPDNPNTEIPPIDAEAWDIAFEPYAQHPTTAYAMALALMSVKQLLQTRPPHISIAAASLDEACHSLFQFSQFRAAGYDLYRTAIEGRATTEHENLMDSLGIRY